MIGLYTVFEHHEAQGTRAALAALHECRITFPVGIDAQDPGSEGPQTMRAYGMQGTPTTLPIDRRGYLHIHKFGHLDDVGLGAAVATLIGDTLTPRRAGEAKPNAGCDDEGWRIAGQAHA